MSEVDSLNVELLAFFRATFEVFGARLTVQRPEVEQAVEQAIAQLCEEVQMKFETHRQELAAAPPENVTGATQFLRNLRTGFLEATRESHNVC